ncbi:MAG TPA: SpvB/TcaC N-terminal domain-containing protein, partial [Burkholderiales bacterium]
MTPQEPHDRDRGQRQSKQPIQHESHRVPSVSLPKGGGALKAIDEKFQVNAVNGTSALAIPLPFSHTRAGGPNLSLQYGSGAGNGPFGLGWSLDLPSIQRRTDKELPRYRDGGEGNEGDVFLLSGAEDLVPGLRRNSAGDWEPDEITVGTVRVVRYRPRIEGLFARIEQVTVAGHDGFYWKVTTRDNVVTFYGLTAAGRVADPNAPTRIFRWLPQLTYDDTGNCFEYAYKVEDLACVPDSVEEHNRRGGVAPFANTYLKRIRYGNKTPYFRNPAQPWQPAAPATEYFFDALLDYGEHDALAPTFAESNAWACRHDPFSDYRAGFEIRTYRLCRRILFFHRFAELTPGPGPIPPCLVRSIDLTYRHLAFDGAPYQRHEVDLIDAVRQTFYKRAGAGYEHKSMPPFELDYHPLAWDMAVRS